MTTSDIIGLWVILIALAIVYHGLCMKDAVNIEIVNKQVGEDFKGE